MVDLDQQAGSSVPEHGRGTFSEPVATGVPTIYRLLRGGSPAGQGPWLAVALVATHSQPFPSEL